MRPVVARIRAVPPAAVIAFALLYAVPPAATAQEREGLWGRFVGGGGWANVSTPQTGTGSQAGGAGSFSGGWTIREDVLVGAEFTLWSKTIAGESGGTVGANVYNFLGTAVWYPTPTAPWFVKGGGGVSSRDVETTAGGATVTEVVGTGPGVIVGAGIDFPVGRIVSWTVGADLWYGYPGAIGGGTGTFTSAHQRVFVVTIGLTFH